ncbi:zinc-binding dehydrogenase [Streptomyces sp. NPDC004838]
MRAVILPGNGAVSLGEREIAEPHADQVLVRVAGAGCNRADILQRDGLYPAPPGAPADIPGLEFSGIVEKTGPDATAVRPGDQVMGITGGGAQAEFVLIREDHCVPVPDGMDLLTAAAVPEAFFTAFEALVRQGAVRAGHRVYVNAAGSGVGTAVVQLATALGARVAGSTRSAAKLEKLKSLGLDVGITLSGRESAESRAGRLKAEAGGEFDVAIDLLGGDHLTTALHAVRRTGTVVLLGAIAGIAATVPIPLMITRQLTVRGMALRGRPPHEKAELAAGFTRDVLPLLDEGLLNPVVDRTLELAQAETAYSLLEEDKVFGKIVLEAG